uniref:Leukocyte cell derived chemotaxin 2 n=1 Tax=Apteryx owenii TaxID=8824 RepID=A0A8B9PKF2_APTOW
MFSCTPMAADVNIAAAAAQWANICSSQAANKIRGCDSKGCGGYNRGGRHRGVDVVCKDGAAVYAPFTGKIDRQARPYGNGNAIDDGVQLSGSGTKALRRSVYTEKAHSLD